MNIERIWNRKEIIYFEDWVNCYEQFKLDQPFFFGFDTETTGLHIKKDKPFILSFGWVSNEGVRRSYLIDLEFNQFNTHFLSLMMQQAKKVLAWNIIFDMNMLSNIGFNGWANYDLLDGMIIPKCFAKGRPTLGLKENAKNFIDLRADELEKRVKEELTKLTRTYNKLKKNNPDLVPPNYSHVDRDLMKEYAINDVEIMLDYVIKYFDDVKDFPIYEIESKVILSLYRQSRIGIPIDLNYLNKTKDIISKYIEKKYKSLWELTQKEFSVGQHAEIKKYFLEKYKLYLPSSDEETLSKHEKDYKEISLILELRTLDKWISTYIERFIEEEYNGRYYFTFNQLYPITGRLSAPIQQLPREPLLDDLGNELINVKKIFLIDEDFIGVQMDYKSQEVRIAAAYTMKKNVLEFNLIKAFVNIDNDPNWEPLDFHAQMPIKAFGKDIVNSPDFKKIRNASKSAFFAILYGGGRKGLHINNKLTSIFTSSQIDSLYDGFLAAFPNLKEVQRMTQKHIELYGRINNWFGRWFYYNSEANDSYKTFNYLMQGTCADLLKIKMYEIDKLLEGTNSKLLMSLHDAVYLLIHKEDEYLIEDIKNLLEDNKWCPIPLEVDITKYEKSWGDK